MFGFAELVEDGVEVGDGDLVRCVLGFCFDVVEDVAFDLNGIDGLASRECGAEVGEVGIESCLCIVCEIHTDAPARLVSPALMVAK